MSQRDADKNEVAALWSRLLKNGNNILWLAELEPFRLLDLTPAGVQLVGRERHELLGSDEWLTAITAEDRKTFQTTITQLQPNQTSKLHYALKTKTHGIVRLCDNLCRVDNGSDERRIVGGNAAIVSDGREQLEEVTKSRDMLLRLIEDIPMNVIRKDLRGRIVFANQRFCDSVNRSLDDLIGKTDFDLFPAELARKYTSDDQKVMQSGEPWEEIEAHSVANGERKYVQVLKSSVRDSDGNVVGLQVIFWDATARREAELHYEHEHNLLRALLNNVSDSIYFKDLDSRFTRVSHGLAMKFGLESPEQLVGKSDADFFSGEHARAAFEDELNLIRGGDPIINKEERETWHEGEDTWCSTTKMALRDGHGEVIGTFGISRDITQKRRNKEELSRERDLLRTIIDNVPDLISAKDRAGRYILANAALLKLLGAKSFDLVIGKTDYDFLQPELACESVADDQNVMRNNEPLLDQEEALHGLDGREMYVLTSRVPLQNSDGSTWGVVEVGRDITTRRQDQEKLREAMARADNANRAKSDFLANMSHEIRTPLNCIIGMTELVLQSKLTAEQHEFLRMVQDSGASLLKVINDILDFSKIEAGKLELDPIEFDLRDELGTTMKSLAVRASERNLDLNFRVRPNVPRVFFGDINRLRQTIVNLVANAIRFTDKGEIVIEVRKSTSTNGSAHLVFSVTDTGIGIPEEKIKTIFRDFEQADTSTTRRYGGTGLGLAISARLVEMMGGQLRVRSKVGEGSSFHFAIDLEVRNGDHVPRSSVIVGGTSVLIVDDNSTNRTILKEMVTGWGMIPAEASSVAEATLMLTEAAENGPAYPLVLTDVNMPAADGFALAAAIRNDETLCGTPIIMLTSGGRLGDQAKREALSVNAHLTKPVKQSELFDSIVRVLHGATPRRPMGELQDVTDLPPLKILLVEDSYFNQRLAVALLDKQSHDVDIANNGLEAVEFFEKDQYDVILMDVQMPEMDGWEATHQIREREKTTGSRTPIIAMTAHAMQGDRQRCLDAGMDEYVSKPISPNSLFSTIAKVTGDTDTIVLDVSPHKRDADTQALAEPDGIVVVPGGLPEESVSEQKQVKEKEEEDHRIVDFDAALVRVGGKLETLQELAIILNDECPKLLAEIERSTEKNDGKSLRRAAHTLQGSAKHFAAEHVVRVAKQVEECGSNNDFTQAAALLSELRHETDRLCARIQTRFMT